ncbi:MAG: hypothetical protein AAFR81_19500 [Chloroflexota bacterium]
MANDIDYIICGPDGTIYFIPKDQMDQFKLEEDSESYKDIKNDPVAKAMNTAAVIVDETGEWQPFGATCGAFVSLEAMPSMPQPGDKLAYINLDFNMNNTFNNPSIASDVAEQKAKKDDNSKK